MSAWVDSVLTTVPGSRRPVVLSVAKPLLPNGHTKTSVDIVPEQKDAHLPTSRIRRKPLHTYKSPAAHELVSLRIEGEAGAEEAVAQTSHHTPANEASGSTPSPEPLHLSPPLPLYHPLGLLAQSVPVLDATLLGHQSAVDLTVDDYTHLDADGVRRSSARARRPAAKVRERDAEDEMSAILDGAASTNGHGSTSPRKRRGGGAGTRRRRRDAQNADGTYPNPPKRTRNSRNPAFASPLAGPVITNEDGLPEAEHAGVDTPSVVPDGEDTQGPTPAAEDAEVSEQRRSTRSRRARPAAAKRRHSSASETTTTSVSVSIATNARYTRSVGARTQQLEDTVPQEEDPSPQDVEMKDADIPEDSVETAPVENGLTSKAAEAVSEKMEVTVGTKVTSIIAVADDKNTTASSAADSKPTLDVQEKIVDVHIEQATPAVPMVIDEDTVPQPKVAVAAPTAEEPAVSKPSVEGTQPMDIDSTLVTKLPSTVTEAETKPTLPEVTKVSEARKPSVESRKAVVEEKRETKIPEKPPPSLPAVPAPAPPSKPRPRDLSIPEKPRIAPPAHKIATPSWPRFASTPTASTPIGHRRPRDEEKEEGELSEESGGTPPRGR